MLNYTVYKDTPASGTNSYYSASWSARQDFGLTVFTTGTLTGTWTIWATDKPQPNLEDDSDWVDVSTDDAFSAFTNPTGGPSSFHVSSWHFRAGYIRLKYTNASGTGNLSAYVTPECG